MRLELVLLIFRPRRPRHAGELRQGSRPLPAAARRSRALSALRPPALIPLPASVARHASRLPGAAALARAAEQDAAGARRLCGAGRRPAAPAAASGQRREQRIRLIGSACAGGRGGMPCSPIGGIGSSNPSEGRMSAMCGRRLRRRRVACGTGREVVLHVRRRGELIHHCRRAAAVPPPNGGGAIEPVECGGAPNGSKRWRRRKIMLRDGERVLLHRMRLVVWSARPRHRGRRRHHGEVICACPPDACAARGGGASCAC